MLLARPPGAPKDMVLCWNELRWMWCYFIEAGDPCRRLEKPMPRVPRILGILKLGDRDGNARIHVAIHTCWIGQYVVWFGILD